MFAILGDVEFDLITYFDGLETRFGAEYAEHALIERKPRLQFVGDKLDEVKIDLVFHVSYCDPEAELVRLRNALASHDALSLVLGNGDYKGRFVITELTATGRHTDAAGTLLAVEASVDLREFTGDSAQPPAPAVRPAGSTLQVPAKGSLVAALPANVPATLSSGLGEAVSTTKGALSATGRALVAVATMRQLANGDVLAAVARLPDLTFALGATLPGLDVAAEQMTSFDQWPSVAKDAGRVALGIVRIRGEVGSIAGNLAAATSADLLSRLATVDGAASRANAEMQQTTLPLARLSAQVATRTV
ncbi:MAG TPA: phage tail protein [Paucimonas sp.]|nr:phage tail protein [Paucimonas sp.]